MALNPQQMRQERPTSEPPLEAAPAMIDWTAAEWLEWWGAMKGRRRTRTFGNLYGIGEAPPEAARAWVTVGLVQWAGRAFRAVWALLESIPGDKSIPASKRLRAWRASLDTGPPERISRMRSNLEHWRQLREFSAMSA